MDRTYIAIDLKSFYASVECAARGLDPLATHLVVADRSRTDKTICLAVSPSLKAYGLPGRARLFEVVRAMAEVNERRRLNAPGRRFAGESYDARELGAHPELKASYVVAKPRMATYIERSTQVYDVYLRYAAAEDIHVYSIDEVFIDVTGYLRLYGMTPHELARAIIADILAETGITATAGIGPNLYLAKVAMDIVAKHIPPGPDGVRVAELDEMSYRRLLWGHRPLTDFWRVGRGYAKKLEANGLLTMGDIARCSLGRASDFHNEDLLYRLFGVNAELLIDHAWGWESCTMADIKAYQPSSNSLSSGQILPCPYRFDAARLVTREMADALVLDMVAKGLVTDHIGLYVGYEREGAERGRGASAPGMASARDRYGRTVPKPASGACDLGEYTSSTGRITEAMMTLYDRIVDPALMVRRITVTVGRLVNERDAAGRYEQPDLFSQFDDAGDDAGAGIGAGVGGGPVRTARDDTDERLRRERDVQRALVAVKTRFGRNAVLKGMNLEPDATGVERNNQIGGHAA